MSRIITLGVSDEVFELGNHLPARYFMSSRVKVTLLRRLRMLVSKLEIAKL